MADSFNRYLKSPSDGTITLEYIDERKLYTSTTGVNFYEYEMETYESILKE